MTDIDGSTNAENLSSGALPEQALETIEALLESERAALAQCEARLEDLKRQERLERVERDKHTRMVANLERALKPRVRQPKGEK